MAAILGDAQVPSVMYGPLYISTEFIPQRRRESIDFRGFRHEESRGA